MNKHQIATALMGALFLVGCDGYTDHVPASFSKILSLKQTGEQPVTLYTTGETGEFKITVMKGGTNPASSASAEIHVMSPSEMEDYNARTGMLYSAIPSDMFSIDEPSISFSGEERYTSRVVTLKVAPINELLNANPEKNFVIPLTLTSQKDSINALKNTLLLKPNVVVPVLDYEADVITVQNAAVNNKVEYRLRLPFESPWNFDATLAVEPSKVPVGKKLFPENSYSMPRDMKVTFKQGSTLSEPFIISLKPGDTFLWNDYVIPIKIASTSIQGIGLPSVPSMIYVTNEIPLTVEMLSSNAPETVEGPIAALIDKNTGSYFHSAYTYKVGASHYIEVALPTPLTKIGIYYINRNNANGKPKDVKISAFSGSEEITLANISSGLPTDPGSSYRTEVYTVAKPCNRVRFTVLATNTHGAPEPFFNMAEFYIFGE